MEEKQKYHNKRNVKKLLLQNPQGISRTDAAKALGIDLRTAAGHLEKLLAEGLAVRETVFPGGKGRPYALYKCPLEDLCFLGLCIQDRNNALAAVTDADGNILLEDSVKLPADDSRQASFEAILSLAEKCRAATKRRLSGIGTAISRSLQPPMMGEDVYADLTSYLQSNMNVPVYRDLIINIRAFALAYKFGYSDLALIHPGKVLEFGLVSGRIPKKDFASREKWLSHLSVNPLGKRCYCGKCGCLENYVTSGAKRERINISVNKINTLNNIGEKLGIGMVLLAERYGVEAIFIMDGEDIFPAAEKYFNSHCRSGVNFCGRKNFANVEHAAALYAAWFMINACRTGSDAGKSR